MNTERRELADLCGDILFRYHGIITSSGPRWADELLAAGYRKPRTDQRRYGVFRVSDPLTNSTPVENMFFDTAKRAQSWIENGYLQPELWEVRSQEVGPWEPLP